MTENTTNLINEENGTQEIMEQFAGRPAAFDILGKALDTAENPEGDLNGLELLAYVITLPNEQFDEVKEILLSSFAHTFESKAYRAAIEEIVNTYNLQINDVIVEFDTIIDNLRNMEEVSESKIDFLNQLSLMFINVIADVRKINVLNLPFELCHPDAKLPTYANEGDSGMDVYAIDDYVIMPGEEIKIPTGLKCAIPYGYELQVRPKSGRAYKTRLRVANTPGTIDAGYRDEICVLIENIDPPIRDVTYYFDDNNHPVLTSIEHGRVYTINKGEKFAQLVLMEVPKANPYIVKAVAEFSGNRGGGFGSSGLV